MHKAFKWSLLALGLSCLSSSVFAEEDKKPDADQPPRQEAPDHPRPEGPSGRDSGRGDRSRPRPPRGLEHSSAGPRHGAAGEHSADHVAGMFDRFDTNHDGAISREEFDAAATRMHERMQAAHSQERGRGPQPGSRGRTASRGGRQDWSGRAGWRHPEWQSGRGFARGGEHARHHRFGPPMHHRQHHSMSRGWGHRNGGWNSHRGPGSGRGPGMAHRGDWGGPRFNHGRPSLGGDRSEGFRQFSHSRGFGGEGRGSWDRMEPPRGMHDRMAMHHSAGRGMARDGERDRPEMEERRGHRPPSTPGMEGDRPRGPHGMHPGSRPDGDQPEHRHPEGARGPRPGRPEQADRGPGERRGPPPREQMDGDRPGTERGPRDGEPPRRGPGREAGNRPPREGDREQGEDRPQRGPRMNREGRPGGNPPRPENPDQERADPPAEVENALERPSAALPPTVPMPEQLVTQVLPE